MYKKASLRTGGTRRDHFDKRGKTFQREKRWPDIGRSRLTNEFRLARLNHQTITNLSASLGSKKARIKCRECEARYRVKFAKAMERMGLDLTPGVTLEEFADNLRCKKCGGRKLRVVPLLKRSRLEPQVVSRDQVPPRQD